MAEKTRLEITTQIVQLLGAVIVAGSALFALYQYGVSRKDQHVAQTMHFLDEFSGDKLAASQVAVAKIAADAEAQADRRLEAVSLASAPPAQLNAIRDQLFVQFVVAPGGKATTDLPPSIVDVTGFFNGLQACIEERVCDSETAHAFFDGYASSFWTAFHSVVVYERGHSRPQFAHDMETFISDAKKRPG